MQISDDPAFGTLCGSARVTAAEGISETSCEVTISPGVRPLFFRFKGEGALTFHTFTLQKP